MKRITLVWISMVLVCSVQVAQAHWISLTDTEGRDVRVEHPAKRVLLGFYFEDFLAIVGPNPFDRVVAISIAAWHGWRNSQWNAYLAVVPKIGELDDVGEVDEGSFSLEKAIAAQPDVAILAAWQFRALGDAVNQFESAGIPVVVIDYNAQTVEKHVQSTLLIGQIMGTEERAKKLADNYANAVKEVQSRLQIAPTGMPKKVYVELGNKGPAEIGNSYGKGMWGGVIELAGGHNIAEGKIENWGPLNPEYVFSSNPDAVFIAGSYLGR